MQITSLLEEAFVAVRMTAKTKEEALMTMIDMLGSSPKVLDIEKVRQAVLEREKIMSTGVGHGFAIPHAKVEALSDIVAAFATLEQPIDFQALDGKPVGIVFMLVGRESHVGTHLKLLSRVSRLMNSDTFRENLLAATSPGEVLRLFQEEESRYFETRTAS